MIRPERLRRTPSGPVASCSSHQAVGRGLADQDALVDPALERLARLGLVPGARQDQPDDVVRAPRQQLQALRLVDHVVRRRDDVGCIDPREVVAQRAEGADDGPGPGCLRHAARVAGRGGAGPIRSAAMAGGTMVRELEPGSLVEATFAVTRKVRRSRKDGRAYLDIELADRSGRVRARVWEAVELLDGRFGTGDTVRVLGRVGSYEGKVELELRDVERLPDGDPARARARGPPRRRRSRRLPRLPDRRDPRRRAARRRGGDPRGRCLPRALPRRRCDRVGSSRLRGRPDRAHRRGDGAVPRDRAVAAGARSSTS